MFLAGFGTALLLTAASYCRADVLFHRTGLGVAIFHGVGGYSQDVMEGSGTVTLVSSWNTLHQLRDPGFYWTLADRFWKLHFTPLGTIVILFTAAVLWRLPNRRFVDAWFAGVLLFVLAAARREPLARTISCRSCCPPRSISASARVRCSTAGS